MRLPVAGCCLMALARDGGAGLADEEIEVAAGVGLHDVLVNRRA